LRNDKELATLKLQGIALALANLVWNTGPFFVTFVSFTAFVITQSSALKAEAVFPALVFFSLLDNPMASLPYALSAFTDAKAAIERISKLVAEDELQPNAVDRRNTKTLEDDKIIHIQDATFAWSQPTQPNLSIHELTVRKAQQCCVIGAVGSGKSTLLQALLGDVFKIQGIVSVRGSVAYVAQVPWIMNGTIKENILFGNGWNSDWYNEVVEACALKPDFLSLTNSDETQVGGQGMNLSGGQKARVSLARAIYAQADVYLLDDVLSAVDQHVQAHLIKHVLGPSGILHATTRLLATNSMPILAQSDSIVYLDHGTISEVKTFQEARAGGGKIGELILNHFHGLEGDAGSKHADSITVQPVTPSINGAVTVKATAVTSKQDSGTRGKQTNLTPSLKKKDSPPDPSKEQWKLYRAYIAATNPLSVILYLTTVITSRILSAGTDVWVKEWADSSERGGLNANSWWYACIYFILGFGSAALAALQIFFLLVFCSLQVGQD
jgi:ATP-binding cassette, subfamily C (CFTR/MRP), member 1